MKSTFFSFLLVLVFLARAASAQEAVWIQIEAHPSLRDAQARAQAYSGNLEDVNGFSLGGNWYGVLLGPYSRADADRVLRAYRAERRIPADSFVSFTASLGQQFWPVGSDILDRGTPVEPPPAQPVATSPTVPATQPPPPDETRAQARQSERALNGDQRRALQIALRAAGHYRGAIDGAFGPATRGSMREWQSANRVDPTGILTTGQRLLLLDQYNAPLRSVGMALVRDDMAGIELQMPAGVVGFERYDPPFARYDSTSDLGARVLLISQPGDQATLFGLYDIMQTLKIVPPEGPRTRNADSFTLEGRGGGIISHTEARLSKGRIKGFTLIWPAGDEARRARVLSEMQVSFKPLDAVLDPGAGADMQQRVDLVAGLEIRKPRLSRSGFYIDDTGTVVTTLEATDGCGRLTLDGNHEAELVVADETLGVALLRPLSRLAPLAVARLRAGEPRLQSDVTVSGYSYEGMLGAPTLTFGKLADIRGLDGESDLTRLALAALPGDAGGPVFDTGGAVLGMLLADTRGSRKLPGDVAFAADAGAIRALLEQAGMRATISEATGTMTPDDLLRTAGGMTVLVSCWD